MKLLHVSDTTAAAVKRFYLDREGAPELINFGLAPLDLNIGGIEPGSCAILAAATGVGKSSIALSAMISSRVPVGYVSLEDPPALVGARILSSLTGIDSRRIRMKDLTKKELKQLNAAAAAPALEHIQCAFPTAGSIEDACECVDALSQGGSRMVWVDYLQKIRSSSSGDRRNEVSSNFVRLQRAAVKGDAALVIVSQFRRMTDQERMPTIHHLKESGDLENEARVILLAHKVQCPGNETRVRLHLAKCTYGGEGQAFDMVRDESGTLRDAPFFNPADDEEF